ncbi:MAG: hypothetical protein NBV63_00675 [Candidatus Pacebacteria bacterium]|nr:hypothetical protein [Candidatus Paceibacterota bacterium]
MNTEDEEFEKDVKGLWDQWLFVVVATCLAVFIGIAVNAAYEILRDCFSAWYILVLGIIFSLILIDLFTYLLTTLYHTREHPEETYSGFLKRYWKMRVRSLQFWRK